MNNKYDCLKLHHVDYLIKQTDDARNRKYIFKKIALVRILRFSKFSKFSKFVLFPTL